MKVKIEQWPGAWGKFDEESGDWLPLEHHCLDVAFCFRGLLKINGIQKRISHLLDMDEILADRLSVLAMLHDMGKANRGFQNKIVHGRTGSGHVREAVAFFSTGYTEQVSDLGIICSWFDNGGEGITNYIIGTLSHHGDLIDIQNPFPLSKAEYFQSLWDEDGEINPVDILRHLFDAARQAFPLAFTPHKKSIPASNAEFQHLFTGLVMLADWIGSSREHFPISSAMSLDDRIKHSKDMASKLLSGIGLDISCLMEGFSDPKDFSGRFGHEPTDMQKLTREIDIDSDRLIVMESETGTGKTEAALNVFFDLLSSGKVDGMYFALPTRVAARNLYDRVVRYVNRLFPDGKKRPPVVLAVPGYAKVDGKSIPFYRNRTFDDKPSERFWAVERPKKFLAAPIAVGTIDQALMSVICNRHAHLRLGMLSRHFLVVDEVHASDTYMSMLISHLLRWHVGKIGGYAMLLSATLGSRARTMFTKAALGNDELPSFHDAVNTDYPCLWSGKKILTTEKRTGKRTVSFDFVRDHGDFVDIATRCIDFARRGAKVLVVMNTVARAISFFETVMNLDGERFLFSVNGIPCPHHGRFSPEDRVVLDDEVSKKFGKNNKESGLILVGTQTLEQSLDIDADIMITDICPADVLIQRIGRIHRHQRIRPEGFEQPMCFVMIPCGESPFLDGIKDNGSVCFDLRKAGIGSVYQDVRKIELTARLISKHRKIVTPDDSRLWVETITHPSSLSKLDMEHERWKKHGLEIGGDVNQDNLNSSHVLIPFNECLSDIQWVKDSNFKTRIGVNNLCIPVQPFTSPFGVTVRHILVNAEWLGGNVSESDLESLTYHSHITDKTLIEIGNKGLTYHFEYSNVGLMKAEEKK